MNINNTILFKIIILILIAVFFAAGGYFYGKRQNNGVEEKILLMQVENKVLESQIAVLKELDDKMTRDYENKYVDPKPVVTYKTKYIYEKLFEKSDNYLQLPVDRRLDSFRVMLRSLPQPDSVRQRHG